MWRLHSKHKRCCPVEGAESMVLSFTLTSLFHYCFLVQSLSFVQQSTICALYNCTNLVVYDDEVTSPMLIFFKVGYKANIGLVLYA